MTPYERLLAEELPTGTFGGARHNEIGPAPDQQPAQPKHATTALEAATHRARLEAALGEKPRRHLHAIPPAA